MHAVFAYNAHVAQMCTQNTNEFGRKGERTSYFKNGVRAELVYNRQLSWNYGSTYQLPTIRKERRHMLAFNVVNKKVVVRKRILSHR